MSFKENFKPVLQNVNNQIRNNTNMGSNGSRIFEQPYFSSGNFNSKNRFSPPPIKKQSTQTHNPNNIHSQINFGKDLKKFVESPFPQQGQGNRGNEQGTPFELAQNTLLKRLCGSTSSSRSHRRQYEFLPNRSRESHSACDRNWYSKDKMHCEKVGDSYSDKQYYLLNTHYIVKIQRFFRQKLYNKQQEVTSQTFHIQRPKLQQKNQNNSLLKKDKDQLSLLEYCQQVKADNTKLKKIVFSLKLEMKSQLEKGLMQQRQEMQVINQQYSEFLDKVVQDKKELSNKCQSLLRENTSLKDQLIILQQGEANQQSLEDEIVEKIARKVEELERELQLEKEENEKRIEYKNQDQIEKQSKLISQINTLKETQEQLIDHNQSIMIALSQAQDQIQLLSKQNQDCKQQNDQLQIEVNSLRAYCDKAKEESLKSYENGQLNSSLQRSNQKELDNERESEIENLIFEMEKERKKAYEMINNMKERHEQLRHNYEEQLQQQIKKHATEFAEYDQTIRNTLSKKDESIYKLNLVIQNLKQTFLAGNNQLIS